MTAALDAIRALAEAATPGPWEYTFDNGDEWPAIYIPATAADRRTLPGIVRVMVSLTNANGGADAAYIAAVDPQTVLGLLAALDRAETMVAAYREFWHAHWDAMLHEDENVLSPMHSARVTRLRRATDAVRVLDFGDKPLWPAYEDADKVADG